MDPFPLLKSLFILAFVMAAGWVSRRKGVFQQQETKALSSFVYNFGLPALFLVKIAQLDLPSLGGLLVFGSILPVLIIIGALTLLKAFHRIPKDTFILFGIAAAFGSNAFFGIPFFESLYGNWGGEKAVVTAALLGLLGIVITISLFEYAVHRGKGFGFIWRILKSPLVVSSIGGALLALIRFRNELIFDSLSLLGLTASGTAVFVLGMFIHDHFSVSVLKQALPLTLFRMLALPAVTVAVLLVFNRPAPQLNSFLFLQSGIPAAISTAILAQRYDYRIPQLTGLVVLSSILSFLALGLLYFSSGVIFPP